jgi:hypothetical protein
MPGWCEWLPVASKTNVVSGDVQLQELCKGSQTSLSRQHNDLALQSDDLIFSP